MPQVSQRHARYAQGFSINFLIIVIMEGRKSVLRQLQHLQKQHNPPSRLLHIGFNQKRKPASQKLNNPISDYQALTKKQEDVLKELRDIDHILQKKHKALKYQKGYLFAHGIAHNLPEHFAKIIASNGQTIEQGFSIWRIHEEEGAVKLVGGKLGHSPPNFIQKLTNKSLAKLQEYEFNRYEQSVDKSPRRWQNFIKPRHLRIKTEGEDPRISNITSLKSKSFKQKIQPQRKFTEQSSFIRYSQFSSHLQQQIKEKTKNHSTTTLTGADIHALHFRDIRPLPSSEELQKMLLKQNRILSMWSPPPSCAQLIAVFSFQIIQKQIGLKCCHISKYFITRHNISRRMFTCLYDLICSQLTSIDQLTLTTSKDNYHQIFRGMKWKIQYWLNNDKVRISFTSKK